MVPILGNAAALAVAMIFYTWRMVMAARLRKQRILCERVAYMLWVMSEQLDDTQEQTTADTPEMVPTK